MGFAGRHLFWLVSICLFYALASLIQASYPRPGDTYDPRDGWFDDFNMPGRRPYAYKGDGDEYEYDGGDDFALPPSSSEDSGADGPAEAPSNEDCGADDPAEAPSNEDSGADGPSEGPSASHDWAPPPSHQNQNVDPSVPSVVFNVMDYGAVPNRKKDNTKAFSTAWDEACAKKGKKATLLVPNLSFYLGPMKFEGPCYQNESPKVEIQGTLVAPANLGAFPDKHWISFRNLNGINVTGGASTFGILDGQGHKQAWQKRKHHKLTEYRILKFTNVTNVTVSRITLLKSKGYHMSFTGSQNILVHDINITAPWNSPNTDGIHTGTTDNINITNSVIGVGDDCVSIGPGTTNVHIYNVSCGPGHGISIGSLGKYKDEEDVGEVHVRNCTISDATNGVRIKTWPDSEPSKAYNISFVDVVVRNVTNPIIIDQEYCPSDGCEFSKPSRVQISNVTFLNIKGTTSPKPQPAVSIICSRGAPCQDVKLIQVNLTQVKLDDDQKPAINETGVLKVNDFVKDLEVINSPLLIVNDD